MMNPIFYLIDLVLGVYEFAIIIYIVMSWLIHFRVINEHQPFVRGVFDALARVIEPALAKIRSKLKGFGGQIDLSPIVLFIAVAFIRYCLHYISVKFGI